MAQTYFDHYVLAGGWAMLLLVPASVVALATFVRALLSMRRSQFSPESERSRQMLARLREQHKLYGTLTSEDERAEVGQVLVDLYAVCQPLSVVALLAPLVGMAACTLKIMVAQRDVMVAASVEPLAAAVEVALVPLIWGLGVSAISYLAFAIVRARLYYCEKYYISALARATVISLSSKPSIRRTDRSEERQG